MAPADDRSQPICVALLGAESTGKTSLCSALVERLCSIGHDAVAVPEVLRGWCAQHGRTPQAHEQAAIASSQAAHIARARRAHQIVVADTSALMVAVYSDLLFADRSLYPFALAQQAGYDLTVLTGLDTPWIADGIQRDGPQVREPVDRLVRAALVGSGIAFGVVYGSVEERVAQVLQQLHPNAIESVAACPGAERARADFHHEQPQTQAARQMGTQPTMQSVCERCSDPGCERRLFGRLLPS